MKKSNIILFSLLSLLVNTNLFGSQVSLYPKDSFRIEIKHKFKDEIIAISQFQNTQNGNESLACLSLDQERLAFIDVTNLRMDTVLRYDDKISGVTVLSNDSIYTIRKNFLLRMNSKGKILDSINFNGIQYKNVPCFVQSMNLPIMFANQAIYMLCQPNTSKTKLYYSGPNMIKHNNLDGTNTQGVNWPEFYKSGKEYYVFDPSACINDNNEIVVSFELSDSLYVYDMDLNFKRAIYSKTDYSNFSVNAVAPNSVLYQNLDTTIDNLSSRSIYARMIYDNYRKLYYRILLLPTKNIQGENERYYEENRYYRNFALLIYDDKLNLVGEEILSGINLNMYVFYVDESGITFLSNNPKSKDYNSKYLKFVKYGIIMK